MNVENLTILADWLEANRKWIKRGNDFDMEEYKCGTVHCAVGWASKIPELRQKHSKLTMSGDFNYLAFAYSAFNLSREQFNFLFSANWKKADNTISGAIARIRYLIAGNEISNRFYNPELYKAYLPK